jgi:hypothetical protein
MMADLELAHVAELAWGEIARSAGHVKSLRDGERRMVWEGGLSTPDDGSDKQFELDTIANEIEEAAMAQDIDRSKNTLGKFHSWKLRFGNPDYLEHWRAIEESVAILTTTIATRLFTHAWPIDALTHRFVTTHVALVERARRDPSMLYSISPRAFEELIAEIFAQHGFSVELTQPTRDHGRDIIAVKSVMDLPTKFIIECKRYARERTVGLAIVQRLYGVKEAEGANKAIVAATCGFSRDARNFASAVLWQLDLAGYDHIVRWLRGLTLV